MQKLFRSCYRHLRLTSGEHYRGGGNPNILLPISRLHNVSTTRNPNPELDFFVEELPSSKPTSPIARLPPKTNALPGQGKPSEGLTEVQISHPWPEWVDLMELLLNRGYFEAVDNPFRNPDLGPKEANSIRTAGLNFARDQFGLIRYFTRKHIQVVVGCGCPTKDRKVVNSGKRLRAYVGIHEGNVCSTCNLRGDCERAFVKAREDEGGRTVDVMRILLAYGLGFLSGTLENKPSQNKIVKESVRRLLKEMVEFSRQELDSQHLNSRKSQRETVQVNSSQQEKSHIRVPMKQGDWLCPKCNFLNFARNIKCLRCDGLFEERLKQLGEDKDHLPLKKGDWVCEKCNFLNFARNTICLQCKEKPPKRKLNPGEWECDSCNYINFRRNMVCLKCDHRRSQASNIPNVIAKPEHDNKGYLKHARSKYLFSGENQTSDHKSEGLGGMNRSNSAGTWRFVADEGDDCPTISSKADPGFLDFPIAGGRSSLSQDEQKIEKWRLEMTERGRGAPKKEENEVNFQYYGTRRTMKCLQSTDDDDMAEWFGNEKEMEAGTSGYASENTLV